MEWSITMPADTEEIAMSSEQNKVPSGIAPLDASTRGVAAGRLHILSGAAGTGKSTASLQFAAEGLRRGECVLFLTTDRPTDLQSHAAYLGIELAHAVDEEGLILLRYRSGFSRLLQHVASPERLIEELRRLCLTARPARVVLDTVTPLLASPSQSDAVLTGVADLCEEMESTVLVTYAGDVSRGAGAGYDYRLDPLVDRAAGLFHLERTTDDAQAEQHERAVAPRKELELHVARMRQTVLSGSPARFSIEPLSGLTPSYAAATMASSDGTPVHHTERTNAPTVDWEALAILSGNPGRTR